MTAVTRDTTGTRDSGGGGKRALLIGIDHYPNLQAFCRANAMPNNCQLAGCVNDAELMAGVLRDKFGFAAGNIILLRNEAATQAAIMAAMATLLNATQPNDVVVFHYSGHGSQAAAALPGSEGDNLDETIVPSDSGRGNLPNRDIRDGQIHEWLLKLTAKTPYVTLIVDSCHSGSITRDLFGGAGRWVPADRRPAAPEAVAAALAAQATASAQAASSAPAAGSRDLGPSGWLPLGSKYVLFAGCLDEEKSNEHPHDSTTNGALTYFLSRQLLQAGPGSTYRDVYEPAATQVTAKYARQHPQLEGARDRELFGVRDIAPLTFARVTARNGPNVTIAAGVAHEVTVGSRWAIYPQGTKTLAAGVAPQGEILLTAVRATSSDGTLTTAAAVGVDSRAVETAHAPGAGGLRVEIQATVAAAAPLTAALGKSALAHLAQPGQTADARAYLLPPRSAAQPGHDPVPQLGALTQPTWAVVSADGQLLMPAHAANEPGVADLLVDNLAKIAKYRQTLALQNPDPASALRGKVGFTVKRQGDGGGWAALPVPTGGLPLINEGERISLTVTNGWIQPIYISILDLGVTGGMGLLYPVAGASEQLLPGGTLNIGLPPDEQIQLFAPDAFRAQMNPADPQTLTGTEVFKLIATANPADFSALVQEGAKDVDRNTPGAGTPLMNLLTLAVWGTGSRDARVVRAAPAEEWTTVDRPFLFRAVR